MSGKIPNIDYWSYGLEHDLSLCCVHPATVPQWSVGAVGPLGVCFAGWSRSANARTGWTWVEQTGTGKRPQPQSWVGFIYRDESHIGQQQPAASGSVGNAQSVSGSSDSPWVAPALQIVMPRDLHAAIAVVVLRVP